MLPLRPLQTLSSTSTPVVSSALDNSLFSHVPSSMMLLSTRFATSTGICSDDHLFPPSFFWLLIEIWGAGFQLATSVHCKKLSCLEIIRTYQLIIPPWYTLFYETVGLKFESLPGHAANKGPQVRSPHAPQPYLRTWARHTSLNPYQLGCRQA